MDELKKEYKANSLLQKRVMINKITNALNDIIFALIMLLQYFIIKHAIHITFTWYIFNTNSHSRFANLFISS